MPDMNDYGIELGIEARRILLEALQALEIHRASALIGEMTFCLATDRVRRVASVAAAVTVHEQRHALGCTRCHSRLRAFQSARMATPERALDAALQAARNDVLAIPQRWAAYADQNGRALFEDLRREPGGESPPAIWFVPDTLSRLINVARNEGASAEIVAYVVRTALGTLAAVTHDVLSPWSREFDLAWPVFELLREAAREVSSAGASARDAFVRGYVHLAVGAPTHLKAILIDGIDSIGAGSPGGHWLASSLAAELRRAYPLMPTTALLALPALLEVPVAEPEEIDEFLRPYVVASRRASGRLRRAIAQDDTPDELAEIIETTLGALIAPLASDDEATRACLQARVVRRYLAEIAGIARALDPAARESLFEAARSPLIAYARTRSSSRFLLIAVARAWVSDAIVYASLLTALAATDDSEIQHAVVVALRHAYDAEIGAKRVEHFEQAGGVWSFVGAAAHPLDATARALAQSARMHSALAASFTWFNRQPERSFDSEQFVLPKNR